jgi:hypothetical protein
MWGALKNKAVKVNTKNTRPANTRNAKANARPNAKANAKANKVAADRAASLDGVAVAVHLFSAMMYGSGAWWSRSPEIHVVFKNPDKGFLRAYTNFVVTYSGNTLNVHNMWTPMAMFASRDPMAVMEFCAAKASGFVVSVSVTDEETLFRKGALLGNNVNVYDRGVRFWDIRDESRRLNNGSASKRTIAKAAASSLLLRGGGNSGNNNSPFGATSLARQFF